MMRGVFYITNSDANIYHYGINMSLSIWIAIVAIIVLSIAGAFVLGLKHGRRQAETKFVSKFIQ
jgi:hypothetical protein